MDNSISDDELAALGLSFDEFFSATPGPATPAVAQSEPTQPSKPAEKVMTQADIDALIASLNM